MFFKYLGIVLLISLTLLSIFLSLSKINNLKEDLSDKADISEYQKP